MRMTTALLVLTLAASTASVAVPVLTVPGAGAHPVRSELVDLAFGAPDLTSRDLPAAETEVAHRLLTPAKFTSPFSMVGLTWDLDSAPDPASGGEEDFELSVRTRQDGTWTGWTHLHGDSDAPDSDSADTEPSFTEASTSTTGTDTTGAEEPVPDDQAADASPAERAGTAPLWVGSSDALQVRLDRKAGTPSDALPTGLRALLVDPGSSAADADAGDVPHAMSEAAADIAWPTILRRRDWGANEKLRDATPKITGAIQAGFVHHTAGSNNYSASDVPKILRGTYAYHVKGRGWSDLGYNFLVDKFGRIWEGRAGGVDRTVLGAHTGGFNADTFGVAAMGNFETASPTPEMLAAIAQVMAWKFAMYGDAPGLDPLTKIVLKSVGGGTARYKAGKKATFVRISGHRDAGLTACPGKNLFAQLPTIRTLVSTILETESTFGPALPAIVAPAAPVDQEEAPAETDEADEVRTRTVKPAATVAPGTPATSATPDRLGDAHRLGDARPHGDEAAEEVVQLAGSCRVTRSVDTRRSRWSSSRLRHSTTDAPAAIGASRPASSPPVVPEVGVDEQAVGRAEPPVVGGRAGGRDDLRPSGHDPVPLEGRHRVGDDGEGREHVAVGGDLGRVVEHARGHEHRGLAERPHRDEDLLAGAARGRVQPVGVGHDVVGGRGVGAGDGDHARRPARHVPDRRLPVGRQQDREALARPCRQVLDDHVRRLGDPVVEGRVREFDALARRVVVERHEGAPRVGPGRGTQEICRGRHGALSLDPSEVDAGFLRRYLRGVG